MAVTAPPKVKLPGEGQQGVNQPSFASPEIQTAPDVRQSQQVTGGMPAPTPSAPTTTSIPSVPNANATTTSAAPVPSAPKATSTVSSVPTVAAAVTPAATVPTSTGAPPGVPATTPPPLPPTPKSLEGKNAAENDWILAQNEQAQKLYDAALSYSGGPTSALAQDEQKAIDSLRGATNARGAAGTINSSLFAGDKGRIATAKSVADAKAYDTYQKAVIQANDELAKAQNIYTRAGEQEKREMAAAAEQREINHRILDTPAAAAPTGPTQAGGVVPREYHGPGGTWVRIGGRK